MKITQIPHDTPATPNPNWASSTMPESMSDTDTNPTPDADAANEPLAPAPSGDD